MAALSDSVRSISGAAHALSDVARSRPKGSAAPQPEPKAEPSKCSSVASSALLARWRGAKSTGRDPAAVIGEPGAKSTGRDPAAIVGEPKHVEGVP